MVANWDDLKDKNLSISSGFVGVCCSTQNPCAKHGFIAPGTDLVNQPHHYARRKMQPIEYIAANDMEWWEANVVKYIARYDAKDGLQDLYKARSYLDMKIRQLEGEARFWEKA